MTPRCENSSEGSQDCLWTSRSVLAESMHAMQGCSQLIEQIHAMRLRARSPILDIFQQFF
jgi:hypothetical protein